MSEERLAIGEMEKCSGHADSLSAGEVFRFLQFYVIANTLEHYYFPWELEAALRHFVAYYNNERYHESLHNVTPADVYFGRQHAVLTERSKIKRITMQRRKKEYLAEKAA